MKTIASVDALKSLLDDERLALVDSRFYLPEPGRGEDEYRQAHIPGAVYAHLDRDLSAPRTGLNGRHPLPSADSMTETFASWGIDDEVQVIVYDTASGLIAARAWWMLRHMGHEAVAVLDGGLSAWTDAGGTLRSGAETRSRRAFQPRRRPEMLVLVDELESSLDDVCLVDARAPERFRGEQEPLDPVAGHIPSAVNQFCKNNLDESGKFRSADELRSTFEPLLSGEPRKAVSYCGSGVTACHNLLAWEHAGLAGARLYAGSWSEWCANPKRAVET